MKYVAILLFVIASFVMFGCEDSASRGNCVIWSETQSAVMDVYVNGAFYDSIPAGPGLQGPVRVDLGRGEILEVREHSSGRVRLTATGLADSSQLRSWVIYPDHVDAT